MAALDRALDDLWRADRDYIIADMNGLRGVPARRAEDAARPGGAAVRRRRDGAGEARRVVGWFEGVGRPIVRQRLIGEAIGAR